MPVQTESFKALQGVVKMAGRHVLVVDTAPETARNSAFLLRLTGYEVTTFEDVAAALNWVRTCAGGELLLITRVLSEMEDTQIFAEVRRVSNQLPVMIVDRNTAGTKQIVWIKDKAPQPTIRLSRPEYLVDVVNDYFHRHSSAAGEAGGNFYGDADVRSR